MPKKKRESRSTFELTQKSYEAAWLGGDAFREFFGKDWPVAWSRLSLALAKRNPIVWFNSWWDLSPEIPAGLHTMNPLRWGDKVADWNVYQELWVRRCRWLLDHPDTLTPVDWKRMRAGSKAKYLRQASKEDADE